MTAASVVNAAQPETLAWLVAQHARSTPDVAAILSSGRTPLTFAGLARQIEHTAQALAANGLGEGTRVALALRNGPEAAVAILAVMSCATCVPLNPDSDEETLRFLCRRLRVDAVIVPSDGSSVVRNVAMELALPIVTLAHSPHDPSGIFALHGESARRAVTAKSAGPEDIALVLHTSGTTGKSKAVPLTQRSQFELTLHRVRQFQLTWRDRGLCVAPMFTATALRRSLFPPLAIGGSVVCAPQFDAEQMLDWLSEFEPTHYAAAPTIHRAVLEAIERRGCAPRHALRFVVSGSAASSEELQAHVEQALGVPFIQTYAMTEAGGIAQNPLPPGIRRPGSVGLPSQGEVAILAEDGAFLEPGELGEIIVRGPQVFQGYEDDAEANRQAFIGDWFRTGDMGYLAADGYLFVTGRLKEVINRGGFKVSPAEVDAVLMRHPAVSEAVTFGIAHPTLGEDAIAAVVLRDTAAVTLQELRDFAIDHLADFKVPSRIVPVASIPKTPLGKVRRRALAEALGPALRPAYIAPRDHHEAIIAELFAEILGGGPIGSFDNFFALGGDSLRSAQITSRVNAVFNCQLTAVSLFRRPTVAEFAAAIKGSTRGSDVFVPPPIVALPRGDDQPRDAGDT